MFSAPKLGRDGIVEIGQGVYGERNYRACVLVCQWNNGRPVCFQEPTAEENESYPDWVQRARFNKP